LRKKPRRPVGTDVAVDAHPYVEELWELGAGVPVKPRIFVENPNPCTIAIVPGSVAIAYRTSHR
jgi:hypothetical protein